MRIPTVKLTRGKDVIIVNAGEEERFAADGYRPAAEAPQPVEDQPAAADGAPKRSRK